MKDVYVQALVSLIESNHEINAVLTKLRQVMVRRGHVRLYRSVLEAAVAALETPSIDTTATVTVAAVADAASSSVATILAELGAGESAPIVVVDPTIIGGSVVTYRNRSIDTSYKSALIALYQSIAK